MDQNLNQISEEQQQLVVENKGRNSVFVIITIIASVAVVLSALIIGGALLYTGTILEKKLDKLQTTDSATEPSPSNDPVDIKITDDMPFLGNADAPVTLVEYADYQCPYCGIFFKETFPNIKRDYIDTGKVKFYYQDFAFLGEESQFAGEAAKCAKDQGKFWEYHDYLYNHQDGENEGAFTLDNLKKFGSELGLDQIKFKDCVDSRIHTADVEASSQTGQSYGVSATPTVFINGLRFEGALGYENYKTAIEKALQN